MESTARSSTADSALSEPQLQPQPPVSSGTPLPPAAGSTAVRVSKSPVPETRNQNACDGCRARKIKCKYKPGETRCYGCASLEIECTHDRPRRKRGPANRHGLPPTNSPVDREHWIAAQVQHAFSPMPATARALSHDSTPLPFAATSASPAHRSTASSGSPSCERRPVTPWTGNGASLSDLASPELVERLLDDWFQEVHAVAPVLHRRRFYHRYQSGEAARDPVFCALVVSVCAATVATLRGRSYEPVAVEKCVEMGVYMLRQHQFARPSDGNEYSVDWCIAMYNLSTASATIQSVSEAMSYRLASEAAAGVRYLAYYKLNGLSGLEKELLKRVFWLLFAGACSSDIFGRLSVNILTHQEHTAQLRPVCLTDRQLDIDAYFLVEQDLEPWHGDDTSYIPGLIALSDLFMVWHDMRTFSRSVHADPSAQLNNFLARIQLIIDDLPRELRWRGGLSRPAHVTPGHDVQVVNLYITSLHLRSNLLQKFGSSLGADVARKIRSEHRRIVDDLLEILHHMPQGVFDANGSSILPKVRDIGAAYLEQQVNGGDRDQAAGVQQDGAAREKLERVLRKLESLDYRPDMSIAFLRGGAQGST